MNFPLDALFQGLTRLYKTRQHTVEWIPEAFVARQQDLVVFDNRHDDSRAQTGIIDQSADRAKFGPLVGFVHCGMAATAAIAMGLVPIQEMIGPAGNPEQFFADDTQQRPHIHPFIWLGNGIASIQSGSVAKVIIQAA